jgi:hypothetical protein
MPRSLRAVRTALSRSCFGNDFANAVLMRRQRVEKPASSDGRALCRHGRVPGHDDVEPLSCNPQQLVTLLNALDQDAEIVIRAKPRSRTAARISVVGA